MKHVVAIPLHQAHCLTCIYSFTKFYHPKVRRILIENNSLGFIRILKANLHGVLFQKSCKPSVTIFTRMQFSIKNLTRHLLYLIKQQKSASVSSLSYLGFQLLHYVPIIIIRNKWNRRQIGIIRTENKWRLIYRISNSNLLFRRHVLR